MTATPRLGYSLPLVFRSLRRRARPGTAAASSRRSIFLSQPDHEGPHGRYLLVLSLGALGIVYGDIGTSPLYALRECFRGGHGVPATHGNVLGILSLIVWALIIVISIKYLMFVMRADNRGEGGILALSALIRPKNGEPNTRKRILLGLGLFGAALLYGDGMITPAISVLSALEGLEVVTPRFSPFIVPATIVVLIVLFLFQKRGTAGIGAIFGPVMLVWFAALGLAGAWQVIHYPLVLAAVNPYYAVRFFVQNQWQGFLALGAVFLCVTGGEALYADMGHFGRKPIRLAWFALVFPSLLLNYFGQGVVLLAKPESAEHPFFWLFPQWALIPMVALSTAATVIASQAVISGAFSLTRQAAQLGYSPRVRIQHTSAREIGQIYIPAVNWTLMLAAIGLVLGFKASTNLAAAYGVAVTSTMAITTILLFVVERELWRWKMLPAISLAAAFLFVDLGFFGANIIKIADGGWFPLLVGALVFTLMSTWRKGREVLNRRMSRDALPVDLFIMSVKSHPPLRVPGTAVFMFRSTDGTPPALLHNIKHNKVLHERVVFLSVITEEISHVSPDERYQIENLGEGIYRLRMHFGFMEIPDVPQVLSDIKSAELQFEPQQTSYFLGRETVIATKQPGMSLWREKLFAWMSQNATSAAIFFDLPPNRVVELGAQIEI